MSMAREYYDVIVTGAGPAGLMAAVTASGEGASVLVLEKNSEAGKKLLLTGHGRCNITNLRIPDNFREKYHENARFLTSAFSSFSPEETREFFLALGVPTHEEEDGRIFPDSQKAETVRNALVKALSECGAVLLTEAPVISIRWKDSDEMWEVNSQAGTFVSRSLILATGGATFPATGSTGDGYRFAKSLTHTVTPLAPALAPILLSGRKEDGTSAMPALAAGLTLPAVGICLLVENKKVACSEGELLFTHQGISGPAAMALSRKLPKEEELYSSGNVTVKVDMLPDLSLEMAEEKLLHSMQAFPNRHMKRLLCETFHLAEKVAEFVVEEDAAANAVTKEERRKILSRLKESSWKVEKRTSMDVAYVTSGGVSVKEIIPKTMMSRIKRGLFFCGELMDIDGASGGYNLQCAWSTGFVAGRSAALVAKEEHEEN